MSLHSLGCEIVVAILGLSLDPFLFLSICFILVMRWNLFKVLTVRAKVNKNIPTKKSRRILDLHAGLIGKAIRRYNREDSSLSTIMKEF